MTTLAPTTRCQWPACTTPATWQHRLVDIGGPCVSESTLCNRHHQRALVVFDKAAAWLGGNVCAVHDVASAWTWREC